MSHPVHHAHPTPPTQRHSPCAPMRPRRGRPASSLRLACGLVPLALAGLAGPAGAAAPLDVSPPALARVQMPAEVQANGPLAIRLEATDDLAGVSRFEGTIVGPTGQTLTFSHTVAVPQQRFRGEVGLSLSTWLEPGRYAMTALMVEDVQGNRSHYGSRQLAKLGREATELSNPGVADSQAPRLLRGEVLTPVLSHGQHAPGTDGGPRAVVDLRLEDPLPAGGSHVSGVAAAVLNFCQMDPAVSCITLGAEMSERGQSRVRLPSSVELIHVPPGSSPPYSRTYYLQSVHLRDHAGNGVLLASRRMGGDTDFSSLFPGGDWIMVTQ